MKNKKFLLLIILVVILIIIGIIYFLNKNTIKLDNSKIILKSNLDIQVYDEVYISDMIEKIDGKLIDNKKIDTNKLGTEEIEYTYKDNNNSKKKATMQVNIIDDEKPIILLKGSYTITVGSDNNLTDIILSADNYDKKPKREIVGDYDVNKVGSYNLIYKVTDSENNVAEEKFTLYVKEKSTSNIKSTSTKFEDVISTYKNDNNSIGIDISKWQKEIDFSKLKKANVEFIMIRVGTQNGFDGISIEDSYFKKNIEGALKENIPVGIYYYSYATSKKEAKEQAKWVIDMIKDYKIDLPIVFDWESWVHFNTLDLSLHDINEIADTFLNEIEISGYEAMLYGSKYYLENIWESNYPIWLAHYTSKTTYTGKYLMWQLCDNGKIDGINSYVDIDIMYK